MRYSIIPPKQIDSIIQLPASKSISNRALIMNALSYSAYDPINLSDSDDTKVMLKAFYSNDNKFDIGAAGTSMRFLTAYLSQIAGIWEITGSERMKKRPIKVLVEALNKLGANIEYIGEAGYPPLKITGKALKGGTLQIDSSISSQYISAILMIAPNTRDGVTLELQDNLVSKPYIEMTLKMLSEYGIQSSWQNNKIEIKPQCYKPIRYIVESDWSAASYWYEIISLIPNSRVKLLGLKQNSIQGDSNISNYFKSLNVDTEFLNDGVLISNNSTINTIEYFNADLTLEPDIAQTIALTCVLKKIPFKLSGLQTLKIKETDRIAALKNELLKLGFVIDIDDSSIEWNGKTIDKESNPIIKTYEDHRMAMAFAPASIIFNDIIIDEPHVVSKSYPNFWNDLKKVGFIVNEF